MEQHHAELYALEVQRQYSFASIAYQSLRSELLNRGPDWQLRAFAAAQAILTSAAQTSKLFWPFPPDSDQSDRVKRAIARGEYLQEIIGPDPVLMSRNVRNSVEHYDDRLDAFFSKDTTSGLYESLIGSKASKYAHGKVVWLRHLDPETMVYSFLGKEVHLEKLVVAMREASAAANRWIDGPSLTALLQEEAARVAQLDE
ncbi:hypothetical protein [Microbacterium sp. 4-7]|uniref:hypothetical protein n=1 Tax=Microbacterium sp. 4-7 TaxID=1885327 RepID=UPI00164EDCF0|nr:hypothetical protein [Microbacterium sp. 4-7]